MKDFNRNRNKTRFIDSRPQDDVESSDIAQRCKFNFSYFTDDQDVAQSFSDWNAEGGVCALDEVLSKIKDYTREPLSYWKNERVGAGGLRVFDVYGDFPKKSEFEHPKHVPHDVKWARFRLAAKVRLIGFVVPEEYNFQQSNKHSFCSNTFYVVFLDKDHEFYLVGNEAD